MEPIQCQDCCGTGRQSWDEGDVEQTAQCCTCKGIGLVAPPDLDGCAECFMWERVHASPYSMMICGCGVKHDTTGFVAAKPSELFSVLGFIEVE